jgi:hypothetical protein
MKSQPKLPKKNRAVRQRRACCCKARLYSLRCSGVCAACGDERGHNDTRRLHQAAGRRGARCGSVHVFHVMRDAAAAVPLPPQGRFLYSTASPAVACGLTWRPPASTSSSPHPKKVGVYCFSFIFIHLPLLCRLERPPLLRLCSYVFPCSHAHRFNHQVIFISNSEPVQYS